MLALQIEWEDVSAEDALRYFEPEKVRVDVVCLNCDQAFTAVGPNFRTFLFCTEACKQVAKNVRWARRHIIPGGIARPELAEALVPREAFGLRVGGYPVPA